MFLERLKAFFMSPQPHPTPDQLIGAKLIQLIATDWEGWQMIPRPHDPKQRLGWQEKYNRHYNSNINRALVHERTGVALSYDYLGHDANLSFHINGVQLDNAVGNEVVKAYNTQLDERSELERIARVARQKMEANEAKWNLAENLLGFKRTPEGALVTK